MAAGKLEKNLDSYLAPYKDADSPAKYWLTVLGYRQPSREAAAVTAVMKPLSREWSPLIRTPSSVSRFQKLWDEIKAAEEQLERLGESTETPGAEGSHRLRLLLQRIEIAKAARRGARTTRAEYADPETRMRSFIEYRVQQTKHRLFVAWREDDPEEMVAAVAAGSPPDYCFPTGETVLTTLVRMKKPLLIKQLLELGADVNCRNVQGVTPLMLAITSGEASCFRSILGAHTVDCSALVWFNEAAHEDASAPMVAAAKGAAFALRAFQFHPRFDVNSTNTRGRTALMFACRYRNREAVATLLKAGARASARDADGFDAIDWLCAGVWERLTVRAQAPGAAAARWEAPTDMLPPLYDWDDNDHKVYDMVKEDWERERAATHELSFAMSDIPAPSAFDFATFRRTFAVDSGVDLRTPTLQATLHATSKAVMLLRGPRVEHLPGSPRHMELDPPGPCRVCDGAMSTYRCINCATTMCADCCSAVHAQAALRSHAVRPLRTEEFEAKRGGAAGGAGTSPPSSLRAMREASLLATARSFVGSITSEDGGGPDATAVCAAAADFLMGADATRQASDVLGSYMAAQARAHAAFQLPRLASFATTGTPSSHRSPVSSMRLMGSPIATVQPPNAPTTATCPLMQFTAPATPSGAVPLHFMEAMLKLELESKQQDARRVSPQAPYKSAIAGAGRLSPHEPEVPVDRTADVICAPAVAASGVASRPRTPQAAPSPAGGAATPLRRRSLAEVSHDVVDATVQAGMLKVAKARREAGEETEAALAPIDRSEAVVASGVTAAARSVHRRLSVSAVPTIAVDAASLGADVSNGVHRSAASSAHTPPVHAVSFASPTSASAAGVAAGAVHATDSLKSVPASPSTAQLGPSAARLRRASIKMHNAAAESRAVDLLMAEKMHAVGAAAGTSSSSPKDSGFDAAAVGAAALREIGGPILRARQRNFLLEEVLALVEDATSPTKAAAAGAASKPKTKPASAVVVKAQKARRRLSALLRGEPGMLGNIAKLAPEPEAAADLVATIGDDRTWARVRRYPDVVSAEQFIKQGKMELGIATLERALHAHSGPGSEEATLMIKLRMVSVRRKQASLVDCKEVLADVSTLLHRCGHFAWYPAARVAATLHECSILDSGELVQALTRIHAVRKELQYDNTFDLDVGTKPVSIDAGMPDFSDSRPWWAALRRMMDVLTARVTAKALALEEIRGDHLRIKYGDAPLLELRARASAKKLVDTGAAATAADGPVADAAPAPEADVAPAPVAAARAAPLAAAAAAVQPAQIESAVPLSPASPAVAVPLTPVTPAAGGDGTGSSSAAASRPASSRAKRPTSALAKMKMEGGQHKQVGAAATAIQRLYRGHFARKTISALQDHRWVPCHDPTTGGVYYFDLISGNTRWQLPSYMSSKYITWKVLCEFCNGAVASMYCVQCSVSLCPGCTHRYHCEPSHLAHQTMPVKLGEDVVCPECDLKLAIASCPECGQGYCAACLQASHNKGARATHSIIWIPKYVEACSKPIPGVDVGPAAGEGTDDAPEEPPAVRKASSWDTGILESVEDGDDGDSGADRTSTHGSDSFVIPDGASMSRRGSRSRDPLQRSMSRRGSGGFAQGDGFPSLALSVSRRLAADGRTMSRRGSGGGGMLGADARTTSRRGSGMLAADGRVTSRRGSSGGLLYSDGSLPTTQRGSAGALTGTGEGRTMSKRMSASLATAAWDMALTGAKTSDGSV